MGSQKKPPPIKVRLAKTQKVLQKGKLVNFPLIFVCIPWGGLVSFINELCPRICCFFWTHFFKTHGAQDLHEVGGVLLGPVA